MLIERNFLLTTYLEKRMYFINFGKCSVCNRKKSVALDREVGKKICTDCDAEYYEDVANRQKEYWISGRNKNARNR
jgi:hypothetical protein